MSAKAKIVELPRIGELGNVLSNAGKKDAVHCPTVLGYCNGKLTPGQKVMFVYNGEGRVIPAGTLNFHGIVDFFLEKDIEPQQVFNVFVNPKLVDKFNHNFEIIGVQIEEEKEESPEYDDYDECRNCY